MTHYDQPHHAHVELTPTEARQGRSGTHVLTILAISTFLASVGLVAFFLATSLG